MKKNNSEKTLDKKILWKATFSTVKESSFESSNMFPNRSHSSDEKLRNAKRVGSTPGVLSPVSFKKVTPVRIEIEDSQSRARGTAGFADRGRSMSRSSQWTCKSVISFSDFACINKPFSLNVPPIEKAARKKSKLGIEKTKIQKINQL